MEWSPCNTALQMGASLHDLDAAGQTALHYAVSNYGQASAEITEFLVAAGCDVNARDVQFRVSEIP